MSQILSRSLTQHTFRNDKVNCEVSLIVVSNMLSRCHTEFAGRNVQVLSIKVIDRNDYPL